MPSPTGSTNSRSRRQTFDASFGHATGLSISVSTNSGANDFHSSATYQYLNQRWNAASFFVKQTYYRQIAAAHAAGDLALAESLASRPTLPAGHTNNVHGTISGPIRIPKVFDGRKCS
jgi:hypothetical protein